VWGEGDPPEELIVRIRASTAAQEALQDAVAEGRGISLVTRRVFELGHPADTTYRQLDPPFAGRLFFVWRPGPAPLRDALVRALGSGEG
jgi:DNA-binding transcriptional LysR family regulator